MGWSSRVREEDGEKVGGVGGKRRQRVERETLEGRGGKRAVLWGVGDSRISDGRRGGGRA